MDERIFDIDGWMAESELVWLYHVARNMPPYSLIVEIGAWKGRSSAALYTGMGGNKSVVSIDTWEWSDTLEIGLLELTEKDIFQEYLENLKEIGITPLPYENGLLGPQYLKMDSIEASKLFDDKSIDVVFIDGDHFRCGDDIDAWLPKVKDVGIIAGHDYFNFYDTIQVEIHKRFCVNQIIHSIWLHYITEVPEFLK